MIDIDIDIDTDIDDIDISASVSRVKQLSFNMSIPLGMHSTTTGPKQQNPVMMN